MTKRKYVSRQIFEFPSKWGFVRAERSHGNTTSLVLSSQVEDDSPNGQTFVTMNRQQFQSLVDVVPDLMGWEVSK